MLVLTRKVGEKIHLGADIEVTVTAISGQQVRLGITAPPEVPILRNELLVRAGANAEGNPREKVPAGSGATDQTGEAEQGRRPRSLRMFRPRTQEPV